jgi:hypothetical protein
MNSNQSEPGVLRLRGMALATAMTFLYCAPAGAQLANPIQAAKDAINKGKQQKAAPPALNGTAPNGAAPANRSSAANPNGAINPPPGTKIEPTLLAPRE